MEKFESRFAVLALVVAGVLASVLGGGLFDAWDTVIGITLILILQQYPANEITTKVEANAYACAKALAWVMTVGILIDGSVMCFTDKSILDRTLFRPGEPLYLGAILASLIWGILTTIFILKAKRKQ